MTEMVSEVLMSRRFRRWVEAWAIVLCPWVLLFEDEAVNGGFHEMTSRLSWPSEVELDFYDESV